MRDSLKILNTRDVKKIFEELERQFGIKIKKPEYVFLKNNKGRIFIINRDIEKIDFDKIRINTLGLYIANEGDLGLRLTVEGTYLFGKEATKNVLVINKEQLEKWFTGQDIETEQEFDGFVILKHDKDFLGTGKYTQGKILNYLGKERRVKFK